VFRFPHPRRFRECRERRMRGCRKRSILRSLPRRRALQTRSARHGGTFPPLSSSRQSSWGSCSPGAGDERRGPRRCRCLRGHARDERPGWRDCDAARSGRVEQPRAPAADRVPERARRRPRRAGAPLARSRPRNVSTHPARTLEGATRREAKAGARVWLIPRCASSESSPASADSNSPSPEERDAHARECETATERDAQAFNAECREDR
jgi:hypothetical protein